MAKFVVVNIRTSHIIFFSKHCSWLSPLIALSTSATSEREERERERGREGEKERERERFSSRKMIYCPIIQEDDFVGGGDTSSL